MDSASTWSELKRCICDFARMCKHLEYCVVRHEERQRSRETAQRQTAHLEAITIDIDWRRKVFSCDSFDHSGALMLCLETIHIVFAVFTRTQISLSWPPSYHTHSSKLYEFVACEAELCRSLPISPPSYHPFVREGIYERPLLRSSGFGVCPDILGDPRPPHAFTYPIKKSTGMHSIQLCS